MENNMKYNIFEECIDAKKGDPIAYVLPFIDSLLLIENMSKKTVEKILAYLGKMQDVEVREDYQVLDITYTVTYRNINFLKLMTHGNLLRTRFYYTDLEWAKQNFNLQFDSQTQAHYISMGRLYDGDPLNLTFNFIGLMLQRFDNPEWVEEIQMAASMLAAEETDGILEEAAAAEALAYDEYEISEYEKTVSIPYAKKFLSLNLSVQKKISTLVNYIAKYEFTKVNVSSKAISVLYKNKTILKIRFTGKRLIVCYNLNYDNLKTKYYTKKEEKAAYKNCQVVQKLGSPRSYDFSLKLAGKLIAEFEMIELKQPYRPFDISLLCSELVAETINEGLENCPNSQLGYRVELQKDPRSYDFGETRTATINLEDVAGSFGENEVISVDTIAKRGFISTSENTKLKVVIEGAINKPLTVIANVISQDAAREVLAKDGKVVILN